MSESDFLRDFRAVSKAMGVSSEPVLSSPTKDVLPGKKTKYKKRKKYPFVIGRLACGKKVKIKLPLKKARRYKGACLEKTRTSVKPMVTIGLDNPANPYYLEGLEVSKRAAAIALAPRTRGGFGGVYRLTPINKTAAGMLKGGDEYSGASSVKNGKIKGNLKGRRR